MNKGYVHKGIIQRNGLVDISQSITDSLKLKVLPSDDSFKLLRPEIGDFEWWYFDINDLGNDCILKIVAHLGTDPLRRNVFPQLAISIKTPNKKQAISRPYSLNDFNASTDFCNVRLKNEFHAFGESSNQNTLYHLSVNIDEFSANLTFIREIEGWKPLGNAIKIQKGDKKGEFYWVIPVPKAKVRGEFSFRKKIYKLNDAFGYHDHNYWKVENNNKLFMDDVLSKWYWGRCFVEDYTIIFMDTYLRTHQIKSLMVAKGDKIIYSSNNLIEVFVNELKKDAEIKTLYPSSLTISSLEQDKPFQMTLSSKEKIDKKDLLEGVNPLLKWLIKLLVSRPAYYGILAESTIKIGNVEKKGMGIFEFMIFRK